MAEVSWWRKTSPAGTICEVVSNVRPGVSIIALELLTTPTGS